VPAPYFRSPLRLECDAGVSEPARGQQEVDEIAGTAAAENAKRPAEPDCSGPVGRFFCATLEPRQ